MKIRVMLEDGDGPNFLDLPREVLNQLGWRDGDVLNFEPVVNKQGKVTHVILEKQ